jgi:hypothetical protein
MPWNFTGMASPPYSFRTFKECLDWKFGMESSKRVRRLKQFDDLSDVEILLLSDEEIMNLSDDEFEIYLEVLFDFLWYTDEDYDPIYDDFYDEAFEYFRDGLYEEYKTERFSSTTNL